ncbi:MAG: hypothetical protein N4A45_10330 [Flavobacteriales bacterium]|jgi:hypothetical protein|nr:hypothetical protein [Flavobacteriales bacterium]
MPNFKHILEGWKNYAFENPEIEELAKKRAEICHTCDLKKKTLIDVLEDYRIIKAKGYVCGQCNCPLSSKLRVKNEKCPENKW